jgi:hypothetical protein
LAFLQLSVLFFVFSDCHTDLDRGIDEGESTLSLLQSIHAAHEESDELVLARTIPVPNFKLQGIVKWE